MLIVLGLAGCTHMDVGTTGRADGIDGRALIVPSPDERIAEVAANEHELARLHAIPGEIDASVQSYFAAIDALTEAVQGLDALARTADVSTASMNAMVDTALQDGEVVVRGDLTFAEQVELRQHLATLAERGAVVLDAPQVVMAKEREVARLQAEADDLAGSVVGRSGAVSANPEVGLTPAAAHDIDEANSLLTDSRVKADAARVVLQEAMLRAIALEQTLHIRRASRVNRPRGADISAAAMVGNDEPNSGTGVATIVTVVPTSLK
jgi:hypothetical protein